MFVAALREAGIAASIGGVGDALMESAVGLNKSVLVDQHSIGTRRAELGQETTSWARWCITARPIRQSSTKPPLLYEQRQDHAVISAELREPRVSSSIEAVHIDLTRTDHPMGLRAASLRNFWKFTCPLIPGVR
ncbi:hypothetical protein [Mycobacterium sp.]|uniref:hypothetical protein n=1 Tax=Mycobacterium sp. TaxID=1785 RepID=UPI003F9641CC